MKRVFLSVLFLLIAGVPTAAYAINAQIYVNTTNVLPVTADVATPAATTILCGSLAVPPTPGPPCSVTVTTTIADGYYPSTCNPLVTPNTCLLHVIGGFAEATVQTNATTIGASTSITTITNLGGTFRYIGPVVPTTGATIVFVTSNTFALPANVWSNTSSTVLKGGFKCKKSSTTPVTYGPGGTCSLSTSNVQSGSCTQCRSFGYTDEGYVTRPELDSDGNVIGNLPAGDVAVTMTSDVIFQKASATTTTKTEVVGGKITTGGSLSYTVPNSSNVEDGHFYLGNSQSENIPCEPLMSGTASADLCASNETKRATLTFANVQPNDLMFLPATSTTVSASDPAVLQIFLQAHMPIDVQPIDPSAQLDPPITEPTGFFVGGENNDFNVGSSGERQVAVLSTPKVNACDLKAFDITTDPPTPLVFLSVAGSGFVPLISSDPILDLKDFNGDAICDGRVFHFSIPEIVYGFVADDGTVVEGIPGSTVDAKRLACLANPVATLIIADVTQVFGYESGTTAKGKKKTYTVVPECTKDKLGNVTCTVTAPVGGSQIVNCCPKNIPGCGE